MTRNERQAYLAMVASIERRPVPFRPAPKVRPVQQRDRRPFFARLIAHVLGR